MDKCSNNDCCSLIFFFLNLKKTNLYKTTIYITMNKQKCSPLDNTHQGATKRGRERKKNNYGNGYI